MSESSQNQVLTSALELASLGMRIFPVHRIVNGICSCGGKNNNCRPGKHPRIKRFFKRASTDEDKLRSWFLKEFPQSNIGVITGRTSGVWVLDIDTKSGGFDSLKKLEDQYGGLPKTYRVRTGGHGEHYYFKSPGDQRIPCTAGMLAPGIDVKGHGGYAIGPGSNHISGNSYSWICGPEDVEIAPAPEWLLNLIKNVSKKKSARKLIDSSDFDDTFQNIIEGIRNITLFEKFACHLRDKAISTEKVEIICLAVNEYSCRSPLEKTEVVAAVKAAFTYPRRPSRIRRISDGSERVIDLLTQWSKDEETGSVECTVQEIASVVGLTPEGTRKCLRQLEEFGHLSTQEFKGKPSRYTVLFSN